MTVRVSSRQREGVHIGVRWSMEDAVRCSLLPGSIRQNTSRYVGPASALPVLGEVDSVDGDGADAACGTKGEE